MMRNLLNVVSLTALAAVAGFCSTSVQAAAPKTVYELIEEAKKRPFTPVTQEQLQASRDRANQWAKYVAQNAGKLRLGETAKRREAADPQSYLRLDDLQALTGGDAKLSAIPPVAELLNPDQSVFDRYVDATSSDRRLTEIWDRFRRDEQGLETAPFTGARDAIRDYIDLLGSLEDLRIVMRKVEGNAPPPTPEQIYQQKLDDLAAAMRAFEQDRNMDTAIKVRKPLYWLARQRQAPEVIAAVGAYFNQVNGAGQMSASFMAKSVDQPVHQIAPIHDNILGTSIHGTGVMNGLSYMRPSAHSPNAQMNLSLIGAVSSKTTGYNGPVTIYSTGRTSVKAHKALFMTPNGLISLPAHACCDTTTNIDCIAAKRKIVERIAWKRASKSLAEAEAIASRHAEQKVAAGLDERANEFIAEANERYKSKLINPLIRSGIYPQLLSFASTPSNIHSYFTRAAGGQLAGFQLPPTPDLRYDLTLQFSEFLALNMAETRFGGWTLTDVESLRMREQMSGKALTAEEIEERIDDEKRWAVTFADDMPVRLILDNNEVRIILRTTRFALGTSEEPRKFGEWPKPMLEDKNRVFYQPMQVDVRYRIVRDAAANVVPYLERIDDGETDKYGLKIDVIDPLTDLPEQAGGRATLWKINLQRVLVPQKKVAEDGEERPEGEAEADDRKPVFEKYYELQPIKLEGRMEKLGYLVLDNFQTYKGWAFLSWRQTTTPPAFAKPAAEPQNAAAPALPAANAGGDK